MFFYFYEIRISPWTASVPTPWSSVRRPRPRTACSFRKGRRPRSKANPEAKSGSKMAHLVSTLLICKCLNGTKWLLLVPVWGWVSLPAWRSLRQTWLRPWSGKWTRTEILSRLVKQGIFHKGDVWFLNTMLFFGSRLNAIPNPLPWHPRDSPMGFPASSSTISSWPTWALPHLME